MEKGRGSIERDWVSKATSFGARDERLTRKLLRTMMHDEQAKIGWRGSERKTLAPAKDGRSSVLTP